MCVFEGWVVNGKMQRQAGRKTHTHTLLLTYLLLAGEEDSGTLLSQHPFLTHTYTLLNTHTIKHTHTYTHIFTYLLLSSEEDCGTLLSQHRLLSAAEHVDSHLIQANTRLCV